ncbi:acyl carrier protein [Haematospirillum sp. H1815]|uniref:acyl carrier protein n=1 Tax=Haematospirillum sp. H1815 TaxID=2723108 RepID=UPI00143B2EF6|nr:acyl carrier protein [Haematospirillum sp. H1815]NKD77972.1 acyl carrier protein [Haematospirillum sp. H1815]
MTNLEKYDAAFISVLGLEKGNFSELAYQGVPQWDSIGHMALMAALEEAFGIELDVDDIIDFSSYKGGVEILRKYDVHIEIGIGV